MQLCERARGRAHERVKKLDVTFSTLACLGSWPACRILPHIASSSGRTCAQWHAVSRAHLFKCSSA